MKIRKYAYCGAYARPNEMIWPRIGFECIADAVAFAEAGTWESVEDLERFVLMDEVPQ